MNTSKKDSECQTVPLFAVYVIWCKDTNMHYVGVTSRKVEKRIREHKSNKKQFLHKEIQRIGWEGNFDWWVVESHIPENLISEREKFWVNFFGSVYPAGYNKTFGGIGDTNVSEDTRKNLSASRMGEKNPFYGKHHTTEAKAAMSAKLSGENAPNYGKHLSDDTCAKIAIALSGEKNPNYGKPSPFKGKKHTDETLAKMSVAHSGEKNGFFGKKHTEATKTVMREKARVREAKKRAAKATAEENRAAANTTPTNLSTLLDAVIL